MVSAEVITGILVCVEIQATLRWFVGDGRPKQKKLVTSPHVVEEDFHVPVIFGFQLHLNHASVMSMFTFFKVRSKTEISC